MATTDALTGSDLGRPQGAPLPSEGGMFSQVPTKADEERAKANMERAKAEEARLTVKLGPKPPESETP